MDCDMLVLDDIARLYNLRDDRFAVMVVKHEHVPRESKKFLGQLQSKYEKKNWSSVMLFNNARCRALSLEYVNQATGLQLHQFKWVGDDALIGAIPGRWNHLVGYDAPRLDAAIVHYTLGGPYFAEYRDCEYSREWFQERDRMLYAERSRVLSESR
jgi:lipopolysaccharide biosynthesis glycosyltransferase